jgi:protein ImuB
VPARVIVEQDGRPVRVTSDRRGFGGGVVAASAGPWRTSGEWWCESAPAGARAAGERGRAGGWNRDEWDVALADGAVYRIFRDRVTDGWFIEAIVD